MHFKAKACIAYTLFSSVVGSAWMGYQTARLLIPAPKYRTYCEDCKKAIMVSGYN